jgi:hypothetical protein
LPVLIWRNEKDLTVRLVLVEHGEERSHGKRLELGLGWQWLSKHTDHTSLSFE